MSEISKQALKVDNSQSFPDNNAGAITPSDLRAFNVNMIDSLVDEIPYQSFTASVTNSINLLNAFTSSQQPTFNALNQFTASQLTINTGYNAATHSLNTSISSLNTTVNSIEIWTASVNEISFNSQIPNYATRWNFGGFISASFVENVGGRIADITVLQDPTKLNTSSFNDYTASTAATQSIFSASVATSISSSTYSFNQFSSSQNIWNNSATASIQQLLNLSSSLSGGYATQGELDAVDLRLTNAIDTKLNTSSFNAFTQSQNNLNVTFATTGSNIFIGDQTITGSFIQSGSNSLPGGPNGATVGTHIKNRVLISGPSGGETPRLYISGSDGAYSEYGRGFQTLETSRTPGLGASIYTVANPANAANNIVAVYTPDTYETDVELQMFANSSSIGLADWDNVSTFSYVPFMTVEPNLGNNPSPRFTRGLEITGSLRITGSAYGNVISASIVSNTASIDLSQANYFTLTIPNNTNINVINPQPGVTATLVINTAGATTASFSSNVKQSSGSFYVPSVSGNIDIISLTAVTPSTVYVVPAYTFV